MINIPSLRHETRYGIPPADHYLFNREYVVGYSYLFKQPRWAAEVIDPENSRVEIDERTDSFRPDLRIPKMFRPGLEDYRGSGYDRGHLVASADRRASGVVNSETFLLTNMSPQHPKLNRQAWRILEEKVRELSKRDKIVEVYSICGPLFDVGKEVTVIGDDPDDHNDLRIPVPHSYFKCVLAEELKGKMKMWAFILPNEDCPESLKEYQVSMVEVEARSGLTVWDRLVGSVFEKQKTRKSRLWFND